MLKHFALLFFAGMRPGEVQSMKGREDKLINLNTHTREEGGEFFRIVPVTEQRRAVIAPESGQVPTAHLRAV